MATLCSKAPSALVARYTAPIPPRPTIRTMVKAPIREPGRRSMLDLMEDCGRAESVRKERLRECVVSEEREDFAPHRRVVRLAFQVRSLAARG